MKVFSYVVDHDNGFAPNPYFGACTLCGCKFEGGKNIVQLAKEGDWVIGTGGKSKRSVGNGKLVYAMRVDKRISRWDYFNGNEFAKKRPLKGGKYEQKCGDNLDPRLDEKERNAFWKQEPRLSDRKEKQFVLISRYFWYFGARAKPIPKKFMSEKPHGFRLEKRGPGFRNHFEQTEIDMFLEWLEKQVMPTEPYEPRGLVFEKCMECKPCKSSC